MSDDGTVGDLAELAAEAYIYGFPLIFDLQQVGRFTTDGMGSVGATPFNSFGHATALAGPQDRFVSINNDTMYSIAQVDVSGGPLLLGVPDAAGRYYVLQFIDAWTNNFAYVGRRASGTAAGTFLLVPPGWSGDTPPGTRVIEFPTEVGTIVGRWACGGPADLPAVRALQRGLALEPYGDRIAGAGIPAPAGVPGPLVFFEQLRSWMQAFPPSGPDRVYEQRFTPIGLLDATSPYPDCPAGLAKALAAGAESASGRSRRPCTKAGSRRPSTAGRSRTTCSTTTPITSARAPSTTRAGSSPAAPRVTWPRALAARGGLWGNHGYEAAYPMTYTDADGDQLDGRQRYTITFGEEPPVDAFWSITMYDLPEFYLVDNPIGRYSIGDRTPGLRRHDDGSLTIMIQHDQPADTSNWLPAPAAPFRPVLRLYQPRPEILDGSYQIPPVTKAV